MDGFAQKLQYFSDENLMLEVPFFQRPYVWEEKNWEDLLNSIKNESNGHMPFIGSFIFQATSDEKKFLVIDGQQRLTTISIFIKAFLDVTSQKLGNDIISKFNNLIYEMETTEELKVIYIPRLTPSNADKVGFDYVLSDSKDLSKLENTNDRILLCYRYFRGQFEKMSEQELLTIGGKILTKNKFFIIISLATNDDVQKIFDSVNSLGQRLTNADIIKNYLFQKMKGNSSDPNIQNEIMSIYKKCWDTPFYEGNKKEFWYGDRKLGRQTATNLEEFLKDYATIKGFYKASQNEGLSIEYKKYIDTKSYDELKLMANDISEYANIYYDMTNGFETMSDFKLSDIIDTTLLILSEFECTTFTPILLKLYKEKPKNYEDLLFALQRFVLMRFIYGASSKNYNKVSEILTEKKTIKEGIEYLENYNAESNLALRDFPSGLKYISSRNDNKANIILFLIEMIRRNKLGENKYSDTLIFNKSLEHIIPQRWKKWESVPCYDYNSDGDFIVITDNSDIKEVRNARLRMIGNMTLLTGPLNSSISNDTFNIKIDGKVSGETKREGIRKFVGTLSIADEIVKTYDLTHSWDERNIVDRSEALFSELNDYYKFTTTYQRKKESILSTAVDNDLIEENNVKTELSNSFLQNESIGYVMRESIKYLMANNKLTENDINELLDQQFSSKNLGCWLPALALNVDAKNRKRYYKDTLDYNGKTYMLCKEWYKEDREIIVNWIKTKLNN